MNTNTVRQTATGQGDDAPRLRLLSDEKLRRIHEATLEVLEDVGVTVATQQARDLLAGAGCAIADSDLVKIPGRLVEDAIESAPKRVVLHDREGREALVLQGRNTHFGMGITGVQFLDPNTSSRRNPLIEDVALACRVGDALPNLDFLARPMVTEATPENPQEVVNQIEFEAMVSNTTKPLGILAEDATSLGDILDMAEAVAGGPEALRQRPFVYPVLSAVSPLILNVESLDKLLLTVDRGLPVRWGSAPMAGATAPLTLAGAVVIGNAESLAGLVLSQIRRPGAPIIVNPSPAILDMKTANVTFSAPEVSLLTMTGAEITHHYGLPMQSSGCSSGSMVADQQAVLEQMMTAFSCILAGVHVVPYAGFIDGGLCFSLEAAVMGDEIIGMLRRIMRGMPVDDEALALDTIRAVGPGGNFLETEHTFRHYKKEQWQPALLCRSTYDSWVESGSKLMGERARDRLAEIVRNHQVKPLSDTVRSQMSEIIERRRAGLSQGPGPY